MKRQPVGRAILSIVISLFLTSALCIAPLAENQDQSSSQSAFVGKTLEQLRDEFITLTGVSDGSAELLAQINRLIALGDANGTLRTYLESKIKLYQLQYEMKSLESSLTKMTGADAYIGEIANILDGLADSSGTSLADIKTKIGEEAAGLLKNADYTKSKTLPLAVASALKYADGTENGKNLASVILFTAMMASGEMAEADAKTAQTAIEQSFSNLENLNKSLSAAETSKMTAASASIAAITNNAQSASPAALVVVERKFAPKVPIFTYNGHMMISISDAAALLGGKVVEWEDSNTVVIQTPEMVLEAIKGKSSIYVNDKLQKMEEPVLNLNGVCYIPLSGVAQYGGMAALNVGNSILIYGVR